MKPFSLSCACIFNARLDPPSSYVYHHHHHQLYQESKMIGQNPDLDSFTFSSLRTRLKIKISSEMEVAPRYKPPPTPPFEQCSKNCIMHWYGEASLNRWSFSIDLMNSFLWEPVWVHWELMISFNYFLLICHFISFSIGEFSIDSNNHFTTQTW